MFALHKKCIFFKLIYLVLSNFCVFRLVMIPKILNKYISIMILTKTIHIVYFLIVL